MAFWSSEKLKQKLKEANLVTPYDEDRIKHGSYELSVGPEAFITSEASGKKQNIEPGAQIVIPSGQFGLMLTEENVNIPNDTIGFISIRASVKFRGLVNVSGFHVDPGFSGRLKFSVYNAGSQNIVLSRNQRVFLIWFSDLDQQTSDTYSGEHSSQQSITSEDVMRLQGEVASPGQLRKELQQLQNSLSNIKYTLTILGTLLFGLIFLFLRFIPLRVSQAPPPQQQPPAVTLRDSGVKDTRSSVASPQAAKKTTENASSAHINRPKSD